MMAMVLGMIMMAMIIYEDNYDGDDYLQGEL